MVITLLTYLRI